MNDRASNPLEEFRRVNVDGTLNLAWHAAVAGVRRFIFLSSIKVNGESTEGRLPFCDDHLPAPLDAYGVSKFEAEKGLFEIDETTNMEVVIIRAPLVYGPGLKANFLSMMRWLYRGIPLPLAAIHNRRSLVSLDNLVDFIEVCLNHPAAANQVFLTGDREDLSPPELLKRLGLALAKPARLIPVPIGLLLAAARILGQQDVAQKVLGSLQVDVGKAKRLLGWEPPVNVDLGLKKTAEAFLSHLKYSSGPIFVRRKPLLK